MILEGVIDYESFSEADLPKTGTIEYSKHDSTAILCLAYKIGDKPKKLWIPERGRIPKDLRELFRRGIIYAHNAQFERAMTFNCLTRYTNTLTPNEIEMLKSIPEERWRCTAAMASASSLPRSLEGSCDALELDTQKDMEGNRLMKKYMKPRKPSKNNPKTRWDDKNELRRIYKYCLADIDATFALKNSVAPLTPSEQEMWELDQRINDRGLLIDVEMCQIIIKMIAEEKQHIKRRVYELSGGALDSATQATKLKDWLNARGADLPNLQAQIVRDKLEEDNLDDTIRTMLEYRQAASLTSVSKYGAMLRSVGEDHRARELLLFGGAQPTFRWTGKRIQFHNMPRPKPELVKVGFTSDEAIEIIKRGGLPAIRKKYGATKVMDVLASCVRGMIIPSPGCEFFCADWAAIEARVGFWIAGCEDGLEAFRQDRKIYEEMARDTFGLTLEWLLTEEGKNSLERFVGKESILGCLSESTHVLTNKGLKLIENVKIKDKLWNGERFVRHRGVVQKGLKPVIRIESHSISATHDHLVQQLNVWRSVGEIALDEHMKHQILGRHLPDGRLLVEKNILAVNAVSYVAAYVELKKRLGLIDCGLLKQHFASCALMPSTLDNLNQTEIAILLVTHVLESVGQHVLITSKKDARGGMIKTGKGMAVAAFDVPSNPFESFWNTLLSLMGLINGDSRWIELIMMDTMHPETYESLHKKLITRIVKTYDILNVEGGNKFQAGSCIVHNCQYGMGAPKFLAQCHKKGMKKVDASIAKRAVNAYRDKYWEIPETWKKLEAKVIAAIENPGEVYATSKVRIYVKNDYLIIKIPSGRKLKYFKPSIRHVVKWGRSVPEIRYWTQGWGLNPETGKPKKMWTQTKIWGGTLFNHIVQGTARDLLAWALKRITKAGYTIGVHIHDEILAEKPIGKGNLKEFIALMADDLPDWIAGCPIRATGFQSMRYHK